MTGPTIMAAALALGALSAAAAWLAARAVSAALVRFRAARLPGDVAERLLEEWLAELAHMRSRTRQLAFALRLLFTSSRVFADAMRVSGQEDLRKAIELPAVRVAPGARALGVAMTIDTVLLLAPFWLTKIAGWPPVTVAAAFFAWAVVWAAIVHVLAMWLWHATPGERFAGLHFVTVDGRPLTWRHILYRAKYVPVVVLPIAAIVLLPSWFSLVLVAATVTVTWLHVIRVTPGLELVRHFREGTLLRLYAIELERWGRARQPGLGQYVFPETFTILTVKVPVVLHVPDDGPPRSTSAMR